MWEANEWHSVLTFRGIPPLNRVLSHRVWLLSVGAVKIIRHHFWLAGGTGIALSGRKCLCLESECISLCIDVYMVHARNLSLSWPWCLSWTTYLYIKAFTRQITLNIPWIPWYSKWNPAFSTTQLTLCHALLYLFSTNQGGWSCHLDRI